MGLQVYAEGKWKCPECGHTHSKSHHSLPGQINYKKKADQKGRVVYNRRHKDDTLDKETKIKRDVPSKGDRFDEDGYQRALYCPHCGYEDEFITLKKVGKLPEKSELDLFLEERPNGREHLGGFFESLQDWLKGRK